MTAPMREQSTTVRARPSGQRRATERHFSGSESIRLVVKTQGGVQLLALTDIECLEAAGNVVIVHTADGKKHKLRESLSNLYEQLKDHGFLRVHRGAVVRASAIVAVEKGRYRKAFAVLRYGLKFEIGRVEFQRLRPLWQPGVLDLGALTAGLQLLPSVV
jgi:DNA-binding LytR/AlgR family response regulator